MVTESIFSGKSIIIPMSDVQHIEKHFETIYEKDQFGISHYASTDYSNLSGIQVITDKTKWNIENDCWENAIWIGATDNQAEEFISSWCVYRSETEQTNES